MAEKPVEDMDDETKEQFEADEMDKEEDTGEDDDDFEDDDEDDDVEEEV